MAATITGQVKDAVSGEGLVGCNVYLEGTDYGTDAGSGGYYQMRYVSRGTYTLVFSMVGYKEVRRKVTLDTEASEITEHARLEREEIAMPEVTVTARRVEFEKEVTASSFRVDRDLLIHAPSFGERDLFRTLMTFPGVTFTSDFSASLYVRGGSPDQNLVLLDNMVLYNPFHLGGFFSTFMLDAVDNVEFLTGGFPARYGNRLSAVLDVESVEPGPLGGYLSASMLATEGGVWGKLGKFGALVTARRTYFDKIIPLFGIEFPYHFADIHTVGSWHPSEKTRIEATGFFSQDKLDLSAQDIPIELGWENYLVTIRGIQDLGGLWTAKLWLGWSRYVANMSFSDILDERNEINDISLRYSVSRATELSTLEFGGEGSYLNFIYRVDAEPFAQYDIDGKPMQGSLYASWRWKPLPVFLLQAGARFTLYYAFYPDTLRDSATGNVIRVDSLVRLDPEPELRLSAKYFLTADDAINLSLGNYYQNIAMILPQGGRFPTNFWIPTFGHFEPQQAIHVIAGYEHLFKDGSRIRVEPYYKHYPYLLAFNEMDLDIANIEENIFTAGAGRSYGVDFSLEKLTGKLTGWVSYSLGFSRFISDTLEFYTSFDRRHSLSIVGSYDFGHNWRVNANWTFATGMPYAGTLGRVRIWFWNPIYQKWNYSWQTINADRNSLRFPPYHRLDIGGSKTWQFRWGTLTARADVINVYNQKNVLLYYYDTSEEPPVRREVSMIPIFPSIGIEVRF